MIQHIVWLKEDKYTMRREKATTQIMGVQPYVYKLFKPRPILEAEGVIGLNRFFYKKVRKVRFLTFLII